MSDLRIISYAFRGPFASDRSLAGPFAGIVENVREAEGCLRSYCGSRSIGEREKNSLGGRGEVGRARYYRRYQVKGGFYTRRINWNRATPHEVPFRKNTLFSN